MASGSFRSVGGKPFENSRRMHRRERAVLQLLWCGLTTRPSSFISMLRRPYMRRSSIDILVECGLRRIKSNRKWPYLQHSVPRLPPTSWLWHLGLGAASVIGYTLHMKHLVWGTKKLPAAGVTNMPRKMRPRYLLSKPSAVKTVALPSCSQNPRLS